MALRDQTSEMVEPAITFRGFTIELGNDSPESLGGIRHVLSTLLLERM